MTQVLRINHDDLRISYDDEWGQSVNYSATATPGQHSLCILFRGTGVKLYGDAVGQISFLLDTLENSNSTNSLIESSVLFSAGDLADGDHQLIGDFDMQSVEDFARVSHLEIENSSGGGFDFLTTGPNATNVPSQADVVDIIPQNAPQWFRLPTITAFGQGLAASGAPGASFSYSFDGVAIWCYGVIGPDRGFITVSVDGSTPQQFSGNHSVELVQKLLWSNTTLGPGRHTVTFTHDNTTKPFYLDFFRILRETETSTLPSSTPTTTFTGITIEPQPVAPVSKTNPVPLAVGLTFGLLATVAIVLSGVCYLYRRRRRSPIGIDGYSASPYTLPPVVQTGQHPSLPWDRKRPSQTTPQPGEPIPTSPLGLSELDPPPSYQS